MLDEVVGGLFRVVGRFILEIFIDIVLELMIKAPGYWVVSLVSLVSLHDPDPDGWRVTVVGLVIWAAIGFIIYTLFFQ